jgi:peroxiredoxin (alkyl hydroperoxide reductase subunit C)
LPQFSAQACVSIEPEREFAVISSNDLRGKWTVLYTYPKDFTFVCPTEILEFDKKRGAFEERGAIVLGGSTDNEYSHLAWRESDPRLKQIRHPLLHVSPALAMALGIVHPSDGVLVRATFLIDPDGIVRFASANDLDVGRNVDEVLRVLDALQTGELVGCNWQRGEKTLSQQ